MYDISIFFFFSIMSIISEVLSVFSIMSDGESPKDKNRKISER